MKSILKKLSFFGLSALALAGCGTEANSEASVEERPEEITVVQFPNENNPNTPSMQEDFRNHLAEELDIEVNEVTGSSYATGIEAMASDEIDVMLVSPQSYTQAKEKANAELFATTSSDADYHSVFITQADNDEINSLEDLESTNFAFVNPSSSSGYLYPKGTLVSELELDTDQLEQSGYFFENVLYSGSHDNSVIGVSMGDYEAAAVTNSAYDRMVEAGVVEEGTIKEIGRSPDIPNASYVMRGDMPEDFKEDLKSAYYNFNNSEYFETVHNDSDIRFVEIDESYYAEAVEALELIGTGGEE